MVTSSFAGREYSVIGWCKSRWILRNQEELTRLLQDICRAIEMRPLESMGVNVDIDLAKRELEKFHDEGGSTASLILSTSHATIHGWPDRDIEREDGGFFWFTLGSCRDFTPSVVDKYLTSRLMITKAHRVDKQYEVPDESVVDFLEGIA